MANIKEEKDILSNIVHIVGNVDDADTSDNGYICHIYYGVSHKYNGFTESTLRKYPWANFHNSNNRALGGIEIREGLDKAGNVKKIIGMFTQKHAGFASVDEDNNIKRLAWFTEALAKIAEVPDIKSIAFPLQLSDDILEEAWLHYIEALNKFAINNSHITIKLFKRTQM